MTVTEKWTLIYRFGVVALETLMGRHPKNTECYHCHLRRCRRRSIQNPLPPPTGSWNPPYSAIREEKPQGFWKIFRSRGLLSSEDFESSEVVMDLDMEDNVSGGIPLASISEKLKHNEDALVSYPGNSSGMSASVGSIDPMKSSTSDSSDLNDLNGSSSDMLYNDDVDGDEDSNDAGDDDDDYLSDYDEFSYNDEYSHLQSQFDNVNLPPGVEASVPWLNDPSTSQNVPATNTLIISGLPESKRKEVASCSLTVNAGSSCNDKVGNPEDVVMQNYIQFKQFDVVNDFSDHHYFRTGSEDKQPPKNWAKRIQEEWKILENDLPESIFVRVYEGRMELLRAVIIGPSGTPYQDGLFVFDCLFPTDYPNSPPMVYYYSGGLRLNPNLYECGKVCLSLLGTWSGSKNENWVPGKSTMLQVLVSIQALILNAKPFFNEPGHEKTFTGELGESKSNKYNEDVFILSLRTMIYTLRRPPKHFEDLVAGHFRHLAHHILVACKAYVEGASVGSSMNDRPQNQVPDSSTTSFRKSVARMMSLLITTFTKNGSTDLEQYRPPV
ncbi:hypothetical protein FNV43_RR13815 [Rhamnella rubrinervis]|uniref:E2 ubiquitin-conjugating enzyme n=1 Tax=Rhamnella rubrinervis TaxID=2594499 RepID=A0A8K0MFN6_9ROSA|nr:hypothetical protein FNV43_RR13815 [Rhamnella rubrinervis]